MAHATVYRAPPRPVPTRTPKRRRWGRRFIIALVVLALIILGIRAYLVNVYGPGLRTEARTVPTLVQAQLAQQNAPYVPIGDISPNMQHAIVAIEDQRFYQHSGIDVQAIVRAVWVNLQSQHIDQGGSTLEEQLAKRAIVHDDSSLHEKLRTMGLAWAIDQEFTKQQILEMYLNAAYYGQGAYGVGSAARTYFGTTSSNLSIAQAAFLAALPQAPSVYGANPTSPVVQDRVHTVIEDMRKQGYITNAQAAEAENTHLIFALPNL